VTISDEDLDRWDARAKEYMDAPCYSFGPDVVAALVAEVRRLRAENERLRGIMRACPQGVSGGRVVTSRRMTEAEIVGWLEQVYRAGRGLP
jgi:hypothetical protein